MAQADGTYRVDASASSPEVATPVPAETGKGSSLSYDPLGEDRDCGAFETQAEAQAFYKATGAGDPHRLDSNDDGVVCESLP